MTPHKSKLRRGQSVSDMLRVKETQKRKKETTDGRHRKRRKKDRK